METPIHILTFKDQWNTPGGDAFWTLHRFSRPVQFPYFDHTYEHNTVIFLTGYDDNPVSHRIKQSPEMEILDSNYNENEIIYVINQL